jgi:hypothetical protein
LTIGDIIFCFSIKRILQTTFLISVTLMWSYMARCIWLWYVAKKSTYPHRMAMQSASTKSQMTTPEPGIEPGSTDGNRAHHPTRHMRWVTKVKLYKVCCNFNSFVYIAIGLNIRFGSATIRICVTHTLKVARLVSSSQLLLLNYVYSCVPLLSLLFWRELDTQNMKYKWSIVSVEFAHGTDHLLAVGGKQQKNSLKWCVRVLLLSSHTLSPNNN